MAELVISLLIRHLWSSILFNLLSLHWVYEWFLRTTIHPSLHPCIQYVRYHHSKWPVRSKTFCCESRLFLAQKSTAGVIFHITHPLTFLLNCYLDIFFFRVRCFYCFVEIVSGEIWDGVRYLQVYVWQGRYKIISALFHHLHTLSYCYPLWYIFLLFIYCTTK